MRKADLATYLVLAAISLGIATGSLYSQEINPFEEMLRDSIFGGEPLERETEGIKSGGKEVTLKDGKVLLNFEDVDITTVLSTISDLTGLNFIMGSNIRGKVTIKTAKDIREEDIMDFLEIILATYNFTMVRRGDAIRIVPLAEASREGLTTSAGLELGEELMRGEKVVTQIIPLTFVSSRDLVSQFKTMVSQGGSIIAFEKSNTLVITDYSSNVERIIKIIKVIDKRPVAGTTMQTFVHNLENAIADSLAQVLRAVYQETGSRAKVEPQLFRRARPDSSRTSGEMIGELNIVADKATNSLVIRTTLPNYEVLKETINKLDIMPKQVLIEVLIAEITLDETTEWGLDFLFWDRDHLDQTGISATVEGQFGLGRVDVDQTPGLRYGILKQGRVQSTLRALASDTDMDVLSTPNILTSDNKQARIMVGEEVPFVSSTRTLEGGVIDETVEFRDVGIELIVTPHINNERYVTLDLYQSVNGLTETVIFDAQVITKREAETSVVVKDRETVVIGGLITEDNVVLESGIPFLKDIPILGYLFKRQVTSKGKNELIILLTPYVIENIDESREITEQQKKKSTMFKNKHIMERMKDAALEEEGENSEGQVSEEQVSEEQVSGEQASEEQVPEEEASEEQQ